MTNTYMVRTILEPFVEMGTGLKGNLTCIVEADDFTVKDGYIDFVKDGVNVAFFQREVVALITLEPKVNV